MFKNHEEAHAHSLETLDMLYEYDDFMASIKTVVDLGCGSGQDLYWWATRTTRNEYAQPLNIKCYGVDIAEDIAAQHTNIAYQAVDFEKEIVVPSDKFDILWCHNAFQYAVNPIQTLTNWRTISSPGAMLCLSIPQTTNTYFRDLDFTQQSGTYYHYTVVNLIHMLAVTGWDCKAGFFKKNPDDIWIHAIVYSSEQEPRDPRTTTWYDLVDAGLLPESADKCINAKGYLDQKDLVLPWLDKSLTWLGK
jgi:SAM-dependent methyltransferase